MSNISHNRLLGYQTEDEESVLDESLTCMHCRFFKDYLHKYWENIQNIVTSSAIGCEVKESLSDVNNFIVVLGIPNQQATTKISVVSGDTSSIVHIDFNQADKCFAKCQNGECRAKVLNKKKILKKVNIQDSGNLGGHIQSLFANFEALENIFPLYLHQHPGDDRSLSENAGDDTPYHLKNGLQFDVLKIDDNNLQTEGNEQVRSLLSQ